MPLSHNVQRVQPSVTMQISAKAAQMKRDGVDVIALSAGEPDFDTPQNIKDAGIHAIEEGFTKYTTPGSGIIELKEAICRKFDRDNGLVFNTDEVIVKDGALITSDVCRKIEELGLERIQVRSPMTCDAPLGVCRRCYGMDMSTGAMVEEGMAVGIIAAQSIGEPGTQLTMRTFHIGGTVNTSIEESDIRAQKSGQVRFTRMSFVANEEGNNIVLTRNGEICLLDAKGREFEKYEVPTGAVLLVEEGQEVKANGRISF